MQLSSDAIAMSHAIKLAQSEAAPLGPNPRVGCVLMDQSGEYLSQGIHLGKGTDHAEIAALKQAPSGNLGNSSLIVTLEPCFQPTKPDDCARAIVRSGIKRVVFAQRDRTPMSTGGADYLRENNVEVVTGLLEDEASSINPWLTIAMAKERPYVRAKVAASLDGKIAAADGSSKWITTKESRDFGHQLRSQSHYLISSAKSILIDQSRLSARDTDGNLLPIQPKVTVLGSDQIPLDHPMLQEGLEVSYHANLPLPKLLDTIWRSQGLSVLIESGPTLLTEFLKQNLIDEMIWISAPLFLGENGKDGIGDLGIESIEGALKPHLKSAFKIGVDQVSILTFGLGE